MTGIQVHTSSPINTNASKSKETTAEPISNVSVASATASTTAYAMNAAQTAQPGASASLPAPTATVPTPTGPPLPQPGQVPDRGRTVAPIQTQAPTYPAPMSPRYTAYAQASAGTHDLSHPPGYRQNHHASFDDREMEPENRTHTPSPTRGGGLLDGAPTLRGLDEDSPMWNTAKNWVQEAGKKLSEVEGEVWKKINGDR